ncbi:bifunctional aspartate kinase/homoserine dehydrogenase II [Thalassotalea psychrophila]|uniref:Bifunctional aspartokinase/homoserine dehydrogenase n=1 Tax=Thalassotalea psychrophila TaxID=3065647 RepID=A0ABY9TTG9_9GAMM|nr:bifunctional aspartate kinase/homoserine dehydrogenase II [Colwelliaceae bacterium SQ149]
MQQQVQNIEFNSSLNPLKQIEVTTNVHKFGGSSLANAQCIMRVVEIIKDNATLNDFIVVSANGKTTDQLFALFESTDNKEQFTVQLARLKNTQTALIHELLDSSQASKLLQQIDEDVAFIDSQFTNSFKNSRNDVLAFGELWSARLLATVLNQNVCKANAIDARKVLILDSTNNFQLNEQLSKQNIVLEKSANQLNILTGFIASDEQGNSHTLGRNGSDYSATIAAHLLNAKNVTLWTDVNGVYSADPRIVNTARKLFRLENSVAKELGRLGNPILHANTLNPLTTHNIHLNVASSFAPQDSGTEIGAFGEIAKSEISVTHNNELIKIDSNEFTAKILEQINTRFQPIYQCQNKTCIVISQQFADLALQYLQEQNINLTTKNVSLIAVVGYQIANRGEIKARFKRALKHTDIAQFVGSSNGHSLLAFFEHESSVELINKVHSQVTKDSRNIGLVIAGLGNIGKRFLEMLPQQLSRVPALENVHLVGLASSKQALINTDGIEVSKALELFQQDSLAYDNQLLLDWLSQHPYDELVLVDITPSEQFSNLYQAFFEQGIHVISANKCAGASSTATYKKLLSTQYNTGSQWLVNTTVGAGLPVNYAINDLLNSGDTINEVAGIFSGTLSWLFSNFDGSLAFSQLLLNALEQGFTEPDPRDDLSGLDVQRKLLILARLAGFELELEDIDCQNLVPNSLIGLSVDEFLGQVNLLDQYFANKLQEAQQQNGCLRYVARFSKTESGYNARVGLEILANDHAFANLTPCDNIFLLTTNWYQDNPLIIQGPGAGRDVTAGGLHSDLVNLCRELAVKTKEVEIKGIN